MNKKIKLEIITPEAVAFQDTVDAVVLPALNGYLGVLPGHAPLITAIEPGALKLTVNGAVAYYAVGGGYAEIRPDRVRVFAEEADTADQIDIEQSKLDAEKLKARMHQESLPDKEFEKAAMALKLNLVRMKLAHRVKRIV
jgi:F-type H+-transporting ATPase subunit epsilon